MNPAKADPGAQKRSRQRGLTTRRIKKTNHSHEDKMIKNQITIRPSKGLERNGEKSKLQDENMIEP